MVVHKKLHRKRIALLHYTYPPVIGGVEFVMEGQANILTDMGYKVRVITASGGEINSNPDIEICKIEEIWGGNPIVKSSFKKNGGLNPEVFEWAKRLLKKKLKKALVGVSKCIVHNVMTMHFNKVLTAALYELINEQKNTKFIVWCHDASLLNPDYLIKFRDKYPRDLLAKLNPRAKYVTISQERQKQLAGLFKVEEKKIEVVPNGVDVKTLLNISSEIWKFALKYDFFEKDFIAFFPTRVLKRKNIEKGVDIICELKKMGLNVLFIITGPPDPHNKEALEYYDFLFGYRKKKGVEKQVVFMHNREMAGGVKVRIDLHALRNLYRLCDMLLLTSTQEGFGLPLLEAGLFRMPIFCSNIKPLPEIFGDSAAYFGLKENSGKVAKRILNACRKSIVHKNFKEVMLNYSWPAIYHKYIKKIIS